MDATKAVLGEGTSGNHNYTHSDHQNTYNDNGAGADANSFRSAHVAACSSATAGSDEHPPTTSTGGQDGSGCSEVFLNLKSGPVGHDKILKRQRRKDAAMAARGLILPGTMAADAGACGRRVSLKI